jgi:hypothetical protein
MFGHDKDRVFEPAEPANPKGPRRAWLQRRKGALAAVVAMLSVLIGVTLVVAAGSDSRPAAKPAVLPDAPFALEAVGPHADVVLPPVPTTPAAPLPKNKNAAGGGSAPKPCSAPDRPSHVRIPRLCVDAAVVPTAAAGAELQIPRDVHTVGIWTGGQPLSAPDGSVGKTGTTLIAGHVDNSDQGNGALHDLYLTKPGEAVYVTDAKGHTSRWRAIAMQVVIKSKLPSGLFVGPHGPRRLVLVTCGGKLLHVSNGHGATFGTYADNVIVTLVPG